MTAAPSLRLARAAVSTTFFVSGAVVASWVPHIPGMQRSLGLSPGILGLVLLAPAIGALLAMILSGGLCSRWGHARVVRGATVVYCGIVPCTVIAPHPLVLGAVLAILGLNNGLMGVAMNAEALEVERAYQRGINSSFHALYSMGLLVGSFVGGMTVAARIPAWAHLVAVALVLGASGLWASFRYLPHHAADESERAPLFVRPTLFLALLGLGTFSSMLVEGAMADWSGIYLRDLLRMSEGGAAAGFTAYSLAMVVNRLTGDALNRRLGSAGNVRLGGSLGLLGMILVLGVRQPAAALIGFALVGAGMANVVPNFFSGSRREHGMAPSRSIAAVSSLGFAGYLIGPPVIGAVAQFTSLPVAMGVVALFCACIVVLASHLEPAASPACAID